MDLRMEDKSRMIHAALKGTICMRENGSTAAEAHALAKIVPALCAEVTGSAIDTCLDSHALAWHKVRDARADSGDDTGCFMAEN
ncbi:hypothetical protein D9615_006972 [Tricholomella constricta]|uniref:Uncharacterized protein n=1 Tax=Tricholomella constricta TaxID=117010 RepID=A0A8H5M2U5_9AGAR|nr:hypothetical protein D9615_006972 [Tricholomella constricta]